VSRVSKHVATVVVDSPGRADRRSVDDPSPSVLPVETRVRAIAREHGPFSKRRLLIAFLLCLALALALLAVARAGTATSPPAQRTNASSISVTSSAPSRRLTPLTLQPTPPGPAPTGGFAAQLRVPTHLWWALSPLIAPKTLVVPARTEERRPALGATIGHFTATPSTLPPSGGKVRLSAVVQGATTCRFSSARSLNGLPSTKDCTSGGASVSVNLPTNATSTARTYVLYLTAAGRRGPSNTMRERVVERAHDASKAAPVIMLQPTSQSLFADTSVTLTAAASGNPRPRVQWQVSTNSRHSWTNVAGATSNSWSFTPKPVATGYQYREYRAVFTNAAGSATTTAGTLIISAARAPGVTKHSTGAGPVPPATAAPVITTQPTNETVAFDAYVTFTADASGNPTSTVQWQVSTNGGSSWANTSVPFVAITSDNGNEYRAVFTNTAGSATTNTATLTVAPETSPNQSGYVAYAEPGESFVAVSASWVVPTVTCLPGATTYSVQWPGIGDDTTVQQDGTEAACYAGTPYYQAWYDMYGDPDFNGGNWAADVLSEQSYPVAPGDVITASVSVAGSTWFLAITDANRWSWSIDIPSPPIPLSDASAEWIVENPATSCDPQCTFGTLADFSPVTFTGATATGNGQSGPISSFPYTAVQITGGPTVFAAPGPVDATGDGFTDTWYAN
jgi:hypothetical protein